MDASGKVDAIFDVRDCAKFAEIKRCPDGTFMPEDGDCTGHEEAPDEKPGQDTPLESSEVVSETIKPEFQEFQDDYDSALESGNVDEIRQAVRGAIQQTIPDGTLTHGGKPSSVNIIQFTDDPERNAHFWQRGSEEYYTVSEDLLLDPTEDRFVSFAAEFYGIDKEEAEEELNPDDIVDSARAWDDDSFVSAIFFEFESDLSGRGFRTGDGAVVFPGTEIDQIGLAIKRNPDGSVRTLAERFPWMRENEG